MIVHYGYNEVGFNKPVVVTIGTFDGIHLGHRAIFNMLKKRAEEFSGESVVITFDPHPRKVITGETENIFLLNSPEEKIRLIEETGVDHLVILKFDLKLSKLTPEKFFRNIIVDRLGARHIIAGFNHHFGKMAAGNIEMIKNVANSSGISYDVVEPVRIADLTVSSTTIREALINGRLDEANMMLGYPYSIQGTIVEGQKIGRKIGYPTANIKPDYPDKLIPANGVYAVEVVLNKITYNGVMSIGFNPTVNRSSPERKLEVYIEDFEGNIYGEKVKLIFRFRLRDEMVFSTTEELAGQIEKDRKRALELLRK